MCQQISKTGMNVVCALQPTTFLVYFIIYNHESEDLKIQGAVPVTNGQTFTHTQSTDTKL